jgi:transposase-like protein
MTREAATSSTHEIECPHCGKPFEAELMAGGVERFRGFKCPHCRLFVPESRAEDAPLSRDTA